jgi:uncharacterized protein
MRVLRMALAISLFAAFAFSGAAVAKPVTDCPLRSAPFSAKSPLIDLLLSPEAMAVLRKTAPGKFDALPDNFLKTQTPSFAAISTLETIKRIDGLDKDLIAKIDVELRKLPVTGADRIARCVRYDNDVPSFDLPGDRPRILVFGKVNGFYHTASIAAAEAALKAMAERKGWAIAFTDKGGAFNRKTLAKFDAVFWNNVSGDVLTLAQRRAFQKYMQKGGGFVAIHGSAGDPVFFWDWYADTLIGARFAGHPRSPQFQDARVVVDPTHPLSAGLPGEWQMNDEWYSFKNNPRAGGAKVLLTLDESSYQVNDPGLLDLVMGADHPIAWTKCIGNGRMFYSAIGHRAETFSQPEHLTMLESAMRWTLLEKSACSSPRP